MTRRLISVATRGTGKTVRMNASLRLRRLAARMNCDTSRTPTLLTKSVIDVVRHGPRLWTLEKELTTAPVTPTDMSPDDTFTIEGRLTDPLRAPVFPSCGGG